MAHCLSKEKIDLILNSKLSVRQIARELAVSPSTVSRIKAKYKDGSRKEEAAKEEQEKFRLSFWARIYAEAFRLSRYPLEELIRTFEKTRLPSQRPKTQLPEGERIPTHRVRRALINDHGIRFYQERNAQGRTEESSQKTQPNVQRQRPKIGTYAVHRVRVHWKNSEGKIYRADVLGVLERATGILAIRAYSKLLPNGVTRTLLDAYLLTRLPVERYIFVGANTLGGKANNGKIRDGKRTAARKSSATGDSASNLTDFLKEKWKIDFDVEVEAPIGKDSGTPFCLPWTFRDLAHLNQILQEWAAAYNCGEQKPLYRSSSNRKMPSPAELLFHHQAFAPNLERKSLKDLRDSLFSYRRPPRPSRVKAEKKGV